MKEKPAAKVVTPSEVGSGVSSEQYEALTDVREKAARQADLDGRNDAKSNKVASLLGGTYYIQEKTWPFLTHQGRQLSVSEFYPELNVAIDKFYHMDEWELALVESKKVTLKSNGIKYAFLTPEKSLADLEVELGL